MEDENIVDKIEDSIKEDRRWCVYIHRNMINDKRYVGITSYKPERRWKANGTGYKKGSHFRNAINFYGWDNFEHIIVATYLTEQEACDLEIQLIVEYNTINPKYGYNLTSGGEKGTKMSQEAKQRMSQSHANICGDKNPFFGKHHTEETKKKISVAKSNPSEETLQKQSYIHKKENLSAETRKKMSDGQRHRAPPSTDTRAKMSAKRKGFKDGAATRPVYCIEMDTIFWGAMDAKNQYGINDNAIRFSMNNIRSSAGKHPETGEKLHWLYAEDAIEQRYITQQDLDNYLTNLKNKGDNNYEN